MLWFNKTVGFSRSMPVLSLPLRGYAGRSGLKPPSDAQLRRIASTVSWNNLSDLALQYYSIILIINAVTDKWIHYDDFNENTYWDTLVEILR